MIGNTEGDLDEGWSMQRKCIGAQPESGAFHDTLARVYYARKDLENAEAPDAGRLARTPFWADRQAMELFRSELEKSKGGK